MFVLPRQFEATDIEAEVTLAGTVAPLRAVPPSVSLVRNRYPL